MAIRLMSHNKLWQQEFDQSKSMVLQAAEGWLTDVQHIGSTAVSDLVAKPVIDMIAIMQDFGGLNSAAGLIEGLNYARVPTPAWCQDELVAQLIKPRRGEATHSILIVRHGSSLWDRSLAVRSALEASLAERQRFENLKRDHFKPGCAAEEQYERAKSAYFDELEMRTREGE